MLSTVALIGRLAREIARSEKRMHYSDVDWKRATWEACRLIDKERLTNKRHDDYSAASAVLDSMPPEEGGPQPHLVHQHG